MVRLANDGRSIPDPTPVTAPFFEAAAQGRFMLQTCPRDGAFCVVLEASPYTG